MRTCTVAGCLRPYWSKGLCNTHYARRHRTGSVELSPWPTTEERFWSKVTKTDTCWVWTAARDSQGYGRFGRGTGESDRAHRYAYESLVGPIPKGLVLDHLCRNPTCVRPDHLEPVTHAENFRRGEHANRNKTHCPKCGGEFDYIQPNNGGRHCRACKAVYNREYKKRRRQHALG